MTLMGFPPPTVPTDALVASVSTDGMIRVVVTLRGEADLFTLPVVVDVLAGVVADHDGAVIVDLADTDFIDSGTVRALAGAWQRLDDRGRTLTLRSPTKLAARLLGVLGLDHLIESDQTTVV